MNYRKDYWFSSLISARTSFKTAWIDSAISLISCMLFYALAISICLSSALKTDALIVPVSTFKKPTVFKNNCLSFSKSLY